MIIFTPHLNTKEYLMMYRPDTYHFYEFNLSNPVCEGVPLYGLLPNPEYINPDLLNGNIDTPEFDMAYIDYIINNRDQFFMFMQMILPLYEDPMACVIIYYTSSPYRDFLLEFFNKFIQARYGYRPYIINDITDLECVKDDSSFSVRGIVQIQADSERALKWGYYGDIRPEPEV